MAFLSVVASLLATQPASAQVTLTDLGTLIGGTRSDAYGINDNGQVVGSLTALGENHAFLWTVQSGMQDLGSLGGPERVAYGINNIGQVVDESNTASGQSHAFLWTAQGGWQDPGTLLGGISSVAYGINDNWHIVGWSNNATGDRHAVLWTIISDPADAIQDLINDVDALNLKHGIDNSLDAKLDAARNTLQDVNMNNNAAAINAMEAFINAVTAQRGKAITEIEAKVLIAAAQGIIDALRGA